MIRSEHQEENYIYVFGHHHVVLASDEFKGTGEQIANCNEFGGIVAEQRVARGKQP